MRVYLDTEFTQFTQPQLISIGLAAEDGREFYAVSKSFSAGQSSAFVRNVVLPIIEHGPTAALDRRELQASLKQWFNESAESLQIVCDFVMDAELLLELIDGQTDLRLREFNVAGVSVLSGVEDAEIGESIDVYFAEPRQWPRHHALEDARALRHACAGLNLTMKRHAGAADHG